MRHLKNRMLIVITAISLLIVTIGVGFDNYQQEQVNEYAKQQLHGIVCWGDSLTAGTGGNGTNYPGVLQRQIANELCQVDVVNMGVRGETSLTIAGRAGAIPFVVSRAFSIPASRKRVPIQLRSQWGGKVEPLRKGSSGVNPVTIDGVEGTISREVYSQNGGRRYQYYFRRSEQGDPLRVEKYTVVRTMGTGTYDDYLPVIFMGQNGGFETSEELVDQINEMIQCHTDQEKYIVLGLSTGTAASRAELEETMQDAFGEHYINLREFMSHYGLQEYNMQPTEADEEAMEVGSVPPSLLYDEIHFNEKGYTLIGRLVYNRMDQLGYFDDIKTFKDSFLIDDGEE